LARAGHASSLDGLGGLPLGIDPGVDYPQHKITLLPGDRLLFYTDGLSEAFSKSHELFGTDAIDAALLAGGDASTILKTVLAEVARHTGDAPATDDRTVLAMRVR
jgi:sigma-B regulation protein RsbU (phosphoserine phosphatase)